MLRVLKRKAHEDGVGRSPILSVAGIERQSSASTPSSANTPIVSHIPVSVASSGTDSADSSISSSQYHPCQRLTRRNGEMTSPVMTTISLRGGNEEDSPNESSPTVLLVDQSNSASHSEALKRRISIDNGEEVDDGHRETKRARLASTVCQESSSGSKPVTRLLATPSDASMLAPLHIFVRQQIEVFEATAEDLKQPSPGRRIPIKPYQVGLRCIHCKDLPHKQRKKRAVCYPSSIGRIYNSVSDMKWSHIPICSGLPDDLRAQYEVLKEKSKAVPDKESSKKGLGSGTASTAKFYQDSAVELGMEDRDGGIYLTTSAVCHRAQPALAPPEPSRERPPRQQVPNSSDFLKAAFRGMLLQKILTPVAPEAQGMAVPQGEVSPSLVAKNKPVSSNGPVLQESKNSNAWAKQSKGASALLACEEDNQYLAPIHCFVRRHVEVFAADEGDLSQPMAGRKKRVVLGQAGLRCIWCKELQPKDRVKRAICYPPSVSGIYHAISNIKHDHFAKCKGLPKEAREEFSQLKSSSMRRGSSSSPEAKPSEVSSRRIPNSTAQYYHDSALRMGLFDSEEGIRFDPKRSPAQQEKTCFPCNTAGERELTGVPDGMAALMIAATDPEVRAKHEQRLKEDSYVQV